jgi:hypothetical protein
LPNGDAMWTTKRCVASVLGCGRVQCRSSCAATDLLQRRKSNCAVLLALLHFRTDFICRASPMWILGFCCPSASRMRGKCNVLSARGCPSWSSNRSAMALATEDINLHMPWILPNQVNVPAISRSRFLKRLCRRLSRVCGWSRMMSAERIWDPPCARCSSF